MDRQYQRGPRHNRQRVEKGNGQLACGYRQLAAQCSLTKPAREARGFRPGQVQEAHLQATVAARQFQAALDPRINVAVASGYFGIQEGRYAADELSVPSDFQFPDRFSLFRDPDIAALICPRALLIQAGDHGDDEHREPGKKLIADPAAHYAALGIPRLFQYVIFSGGQEFDDASAWAFVRAHL